MTQQNPPDLALSNILKLIEEDFAYSVHVATEIEFYLTGGDAAQDNLVLAQIIKQCQDDEIVIAGMNLETGHRQYEIALVAVNNAALICDATNCLKNIISNIAAQAGMTADFAAKPCDQQPGSGLHVHIHLENSHHFNVFQKGAADNDDESETLEYAVGGLLDTMAESMIYFAPHTDDYKRYTARNNDDIPDDKPLRRYNNAPIKISWGSNNRTVAVRVPSSTIHPESRHIEHRVASANADIYQLMTAILAGVHHGLSHKIQPSEKIHGNAFDSQYDRPLLPQSLQEAKIAAKRGEVITAYMQE